MTGTSGQKLTEIYVESAGELFTACNFRHGGLLFDQWEGLGGTVINRTWPLSSFVAFMAPATFLSLAGAGVVHDSRDFIAEGLKRYAGTDKFPLASPWLMVDFGETPPRVTGHEGRNRMRAIAALGIEGDIPVLVHPVRGLALDHIGPRHLSALFEKAISQDRAPVTGPLFSRALIGNRLFAVAPA